LKGQPSLLNAKLKLKKKHSFHEFFNKKPYISVFYSFFAIVQKQVTPQALEKIETLTHPNEASDTAFALKKVSAFYELKEMVCPAYQHQFQAVITQKEDQTYPFSFSIEGMIDKCTCFCGQVGKENFFYQSKKMKQS